MKRISLLIALVFTLLGCISLQGLVPKVSNENHLPVPTPPPSGYSSQSWPASLPKTLPHMAVSQRVELASGYMEYLRTIAQMAAYSKARQDDASFRYLKQAGDRMVSQIVRHILDDKDAYVIAQSRSAIAMLHYHVARYHYHMGDTSQAAREADVIAQRYMKDQKNLTVQFLEDTPVELANALISLQRDIEQENASKKEKNGSTES